MYAHQARYQAHHLKTELEILASGAQSIEKSFRETLWVVDKMQSGEVEMFRLRFLFVQNLLGSF